MSDLLTTDEANYLATLAQGGDMDAYNYIAKHVIAVSKIVLANNNVGNRVRWDDATQEISLAVIKRFHKWDVTRSGFRTWLIMQVHQGMQEFFSNERLIYIPQKTWEKFQKDEPSNLTGDVKAALNIQPVDGEDVNLNWVVDQELLPSQKADYTKVNEELDNLTPNQRDVIRMRFWDDMTLEEIGSSLGFTKERARQLESMAIKTLNKRLNVYSPLPSNPTL